MTRPLVSAVISTYNRYDRLQAAIASALAQTYRPIEIIVVNDGSTDPRYRGPHPAGVTWIDLPANTRQTHGFPCLGHVRNVGIRHAKGDYLAFLDDDDTWLPHKLERQMDEIQSTGAGMCCTEIFATDGSPSPEFRYPRYYRDHVGVHLPPDITFEHVGEKNLIAHSSVVLARAVFDQAGPYPEIPLQGHVVNGRLEVEDWELWRACLRYTRCRFIEEPLVTYDCKFGKLSRPTYRFRIAVRRKIRALMGDTSPLPLRF